MSMCEDEDRLYHRCLIVVVGVGLWVVVCYVLLCDMMRMDEYYYQTDDDDDEDGCDR